MKRYVAAYLRRAGIKAPPGPRARAKVRRLAFREWQLDLRRRPEWVAHITAHPGDRQWSSGELEAKHRWQRLFRRQRSRQTVVNDARNYMRTKWREIPGGGR